MRAQWLSYLLLLGCCLSEGRAENLQFLERTDNHLVLTNCDDCNSDPIDVSENPVPFGDYFHNVIHIAANGLISFGKTFASFGATLFPSETFPVIHSSFVAAPYWEDVDNTFFGEIWYETHTWGENETSNQLLERVSNYLQDWLNDTSFNGTWMIVATWNDSVRYSDEADNTTNFNETNTFQGVIITNFTKTYAVFIYLCDLIQWSNRSVIGFNAGGIYWANHNLSVQGFSSNIDCVNIPTSPWNNVVYDVNPNGTTLNSTLSTKGSCIDAGYIDCCSDGTSCVGAPIRDCYCDNSCHLFNDCCHDIDNTCERGEVAQDNDTFLLVAASFTIFRVSLSGTASFVAPLSIGTHYIGLDFDYSRNYLYYSDVRRDIIGRAPLNDSVTPQNNEIVVSLENEFIEGIAVDWVSNNIYWTDTAHRNIEVFDLDVMERALVLQTDPHTAPRAIVVDPSARYMYWTDWGSPARIERASMDGTDRQVLHDTNLTWPNALTIDHSSGRIYWLDAFLETVEYSDLDGANREVLIEDMSGSFHPFSVTVAGDQLFWTDWLNQSIFTSHKEIANTFLEIYQNPFFLFNSIIAVDDKIQSTDITNYCEDNPCSHLCLLSASSPKNFTCACPIGAELLKDGITCRVIDVSNGSNVTEGPPQSGSCAAAGYNDCCRGGLCAGSPPICFCGITCQVFGDCCDDIFITCPLVQTLPPIVPTNETEPTTPPTTPSAATTTTAGETTSTTVATTTETTTVRSVTTGSTTTQGETTSTTVATTTETTTVRSVTTGSTTTQGETSAISTTVGSGTTQGPGITNTSRGNGGAIAAGVIIGLLLLLVIAIAVVIVIWLVWKHKKTKQYGTFENDAFPLTINGKSDATFKPQMNIYETQNIASGSEKDVILLGVESGKVSYSPHIRPSPPSQVEEEEDTSLTTDREQLAWSY